MRENEPPGLFNRGGKKIVLRTEGAWREYSEIRTHGGQHSPIGVKRRIEPRMRSRSSFGRRRPPDLLDGNGIGVGSDCQRETGTKHEL